MSNLVKYNSATRVLELIDAIKEAGDAVMAMLAWASVFDIVSDDQARPYLVAQKLNLVFDELAFLEAALVAEGHASPDVYRDGLTAARAAFSPLHLHATIATQKGMLPLEIQRSFKVMVAMLREQDRKPDEGELLEMRRLIDDLQSTVSSSDLSTSMISMICSHIELLRRALSNFPISGPRVFQIAINNMRPEFFENRDEFSQNQDSFALQLYQKLLTKAAELAVSPESAKDLHTIAPLLQNFGGNSMKVLTSPG